ncbi:unnamed protein product [Cunninghamella echinulata]
MSFIRCSKLLSKPWSTSKIPSKHYYSSFHKHHMTTMNTKTPYYTITSHVTWDLKSGKLVSFVSLSSKTSLTLLPHTFRRDNGKLVGKLLVSIPVIGIALLIVVGLDQAPNTSRLRFVYLTEEEEHEELEKAFKEHIAMNEQYKLPSDHPTVHWLQSIVNNIAKVSGEDIRDPVQPYANQQQNDNEQQQQPLYKVTVLADGNTLNASCCGKNIIVYDLLLQLFDYDENKIAVILSHEIAHSVQRHYVETHGLASFLLMLGDISRGVFWAVTESLGPYVNQFIHDFIVGFITLETGTTYNRPLEKEADLVGLKFLAKAGYDPTIAVDVWTKMALVEELTKKLIEEEQKQEQERNKINNNNNEEDALETAYTVTDLMTAALTSWFGSTHPPSEERVKYMEENMEEAVALYKDAIRINGSPNHVFMTDDEVIDIKSSSWFWGFYNRFFGLRS